ncbi:TPA: hypothetical protein L3316_001563 [Vibrio cholerae]|uniref:hypothetical protein n=1 Tax=Vibrio cholerae TaxID=666 RepID=UPI000D34D729|nr:hypothetical protein [Vibrio cholerae]HBN6946158.1 hypothetical protein [Vibrio cholerae]HBN6963775.1 hypothetical protein [Vibrio cholerae]
MQSTNQTISKANYMEILYMHRSHLEVRVGVLMEVIEDEKTSPQEKLRAAEAELSFIESSIECLEKDDFTEVEVIQDGDAFTFKIKESSND